MGVPGSNHIYLGLWEKEEDAAKAYDRAIVRLRGPSATTNFALSFYRCIPGLFVQHRRMLCCAWLACFATFVYIDGMFIVDAMRVDEEVHGSGCRQEVADYFWLQEQTKCDDFGELTKAMGWPENWFDSWVKYGRLVHELPSRPQGQAGAVVPPALQVGLSD